MGFGANYKDQEKKKRKKGEEGVRSRGYQIWVSRQTPKTKNKKRRGLYQEEKQKELAVGSSRGERDSKAESCRRK